MAFERIQLPHPQLVPRAIAFSIPALSPCKLKKEETEESQNVML